MKLLKILKDDEPILRRVAKRVDTIDQELKDLANNMFYTMSHNKGIGMAAPQVGVSKCLIVFDCSTSTLDQNNLGIMINPKIERLDMEREIAPEGCLSIPDRTVRVYRDTSIRVEYYSLSGEKKIRDFHGLAARVIQHEVDHLSGRLMTDYEG